MLKHRYVLTSLALAACCTTHAQTQSATVETEGTPSTQKTEPRIIRGNDRVVAAPRQIPVLAGAGSAYKFEEAPILDVVHLFLREVLKVDYILHQPIAGTVTLATRGEVSPDDALMLLESALQANGLLIARDSRGVYHVGRPEALKGVIAAPRQAGNGPLPPGYGAVIVPLQYIGAAEMATILKPMMPAEALVRVDNVRNLLVLVGTRVQAEGWLDLVSTFDVDLLKGMSVGVFPLKHASVREVEAALQLLNAGGGGGGSALTAARPAGGNVASAPVSAGGATALAESFPLYGALRVMPIERLNSILVVTPRASYLDEARRWIERLDQPNDNSAEPQLFIYQVQNGNARHLASVLSGIFGGSTSGATANSGVAPGLASATGTTGGTRSAFGGAGGSTNSVFGSNTTGSGLGMRAGGLLAGSASGQNTGNPASVAAMLGSVRVMADELNNSVLIWGSRAEYAKIEATLKRLDLPPTQVLIEASIVEVTLNDDLQYGLEWAFKDGRSGTDYTGLGTLNSQKNPLTALGNGFSYALKNPAGNVTALLRALSSKTSVKMIASPTLMVLDNHTAAITVGNQTPILVGTTSNLDTNNTIQNYQYKDTGVNLMVTPSVNSGNIVTMQVDQSLTDVGAADDVTGQRSFLQRQLSSKVAVRSGESIVMGGLIQDRGTTSKSGVPLLHTLPIVGNLFGSTTTDGARTELIVIITPRVVRSDIDVREVSEDLRDRMRGLKGVINASGQAVVAQPLDPVVPLPSN